MACVHRAKERQGEEGRKRAVCASRGLAWRPGKEEKSGRERAKGVGQEGGRRAGERKEEAKEA